MLQDIPRAVAQLGEPAFRRVLLRGLGLTLLAFLLVGVLTWYLLSLVPPFESGWWSWLNILVEFGTGVGLLLAMAFLFPAVVTTFMGLFLDDVAEAVEKRHYPADSPGRELPIWPAIGLSLRFLGIVIGLNILILPLYVVTFWFPPLSMVLFYGLNGYLLGREYFELVAWRHVPRDEARRLRRRNLGRLWFAGALMTFMFTIPFVNIVWPLVSTAAMVHFFKRAERRDRSRRARASAGQ